VKDETFISRWSRRKIESKTATPPPPEESAPAPLAPVDRAEPAEQPPAPLPPLESLTPESDFAPFMQPEVDPGLKRQALKTLFQDPQFNVMDGLDVYIDDYSKPDPLPEGWLEKLEQVKRLGIFTPAEEKPPEGAVAQAAPLQKAIERPPAGPTSEDDPPDTSTPPVASSQEGKS
jgi:uncharacterized protein DUF3306